MIKIQEQKKEKKKNRFVKHNEKIQKAKKIAGTIVGGVAVVGVGVAKYGKEIVKHAPQAAKVAADVVKTVAKL